MPLRDVVYALRSLRKSPVFALTAVITMALGIGAATTIFSVTHAVLLRPLPYKNPDRLVFAISDMRRRSVKDFPVSDAEFIDIRNGTTDAFEDIAGVTTGRNTVPQQDGTLEQTRFAVVTPNFFPLLGARIAFGRDFTAADGQAPPPPPAGATAGTAPTGPAQATILSYDYFERRFGGDTSILGHDMPGAPPGRTIIVGVLAPGMELLFSPDANEERRPDMWFAARLVYNNQTRNNVRWRIIARLKLGVTLERAQSAADRISAQIRRNFIIENTAGFAVRLEPMQRHVVEAVRPALMALMGAVIFLLLIACANVANLMLVRASLREREMAVRTALGGSWWRLARQTLVEAMLLAFIGAAAGLALAALGLHELRTIAPADLPRVETIVIDPVVVAFAAAAALLAAAIFGLVPAWRASRPDVAQVLRASGRTAGLIGGGWLRNAVVVAEVALCFVLLIGSGLMFRSFLALIRIQPGFDPNGLLTFQLLGNRGGTQPEQRAAFEREVHDRLASIPGVRAVAGSFPLPLAGGFSPIRWGLEPALSDPSRFQAVDFEIVYPGYFEAMRTPLLAGRTFTDADNAPDRNGVVIDEFLASKAFPRESAVGRRILVRLRSLQPEWVEVLGVVQHVRTTSLADPGREQVYFTDGYLSYGAVGSWAIRTYGDPARMASAVRAEMAKLGPKVLITEMKPMDALVEKAESGTRFSLLLIGVFATVAALLASVGLYGVLSTVVRQRTAEIGVRMALGAAPARIFGQVVAQGLRLSALGIAIGLAGAFVLTRAIASLLVGVSRTDPLTFAAMALLFLAVAAVASWLPALRAAGLDPSSALREE